MLRDDDEIAVILADLCHSAGGTLYLDELVTVPRSVIDWLRQRENKPWTNGQTTPELLRIAGEWIKSRLTPPETNKIVACHR